MYYRLQLKARFVSMKAQPSLLSQDNKKPLRAWQVGLYDHWASIDYTLLFVVSQIDLHSYSITTRMMPAMDQVNLKIGEMNCTACSSSVEKALSGIDGVETVSVSFSTGRGTVTGTNLDGEALAEVATAAGYPSTIEDAGIDPAKMATEIEQRQQKNAANWRHRALIGVAIWAPAASLH